jgi:DNA (cytosine-5)-methyltransferase 1
MVKRNDQETNRQSYVAAIDGLLMPRDDGRWVAVDLFAGCGGLSLGFESAGIRTVGYEMNGDCCKTYNMNLVGHCHQITLGPDSEIEPADIVIGGPPCQPFSVGGHQRGLEDSRDGFPVFINAVERLRPRIWLFENVRGLLYKNRWYLDQVIRKLERMGYVVDSLLANAADYGVPQNRERLIVVGHKGHFRFPPKARNKVSAGEALAGLPDVMPEDAKYLTPNMDKYIAKYERASKCINPRDLDLSRPARTLTCRNLAGATGDMQRILLPDGRRRRLTVREAARLQSFPDWFRFVGNETSQFNQIGNGVAPLFAHALATAVVEYLSRKDTLSEEEIKNRWSASQISLAV